jgi:hypothetical protein
MGGGGLPGKLSDCSEQDLQNVKCMSREIRQVERLNKVVTVLSNYFAITW